MGEPVRSATQPGADTGGPDPVASLQRKVEYLEAFCRSVAHDLRNPLYAVDGFVHLLLDSDEGKISHENREYVAYIGRAIAEIAAMLDGLRSLSDTAARALTLDTIDLAAIARNVAASLANRHAHGVAFTVLDMPPVFSDARLMAIVMHNLLGNAWKFTAHADAAAVNLGGFVSADGSVTCFVRDNGVGFDTAAAETIFLPFKRLHAATAFEGSGTGLATVKTIFDRLGGRVWAEGTPGQGATFYFTLPARSGHDQ